MTTYMPYKPSDLNALIESQGLAGFNHTNSFGVEITKTFLGGWVEGGFRYLAKVALSGEFTNNSSKAALGQHCFQVVGRASLLQTGILRADLVAGLGGTNTEFKIEGPTSNISINRTAAEDWVSSPMMSAGASVSVGFGGVYLSLEAGYERNLVTQMNRSGNISSTISTLDFSGPYGMVALFFDGIPGYRK
jgi:hypothetical protein